MPLDRRLDPVALRDAYQPHWVWAVAFVAVPFGLLLFGFLGLTTGSPVPLSVASTAPKVGLWIAGAGMAAAIIRWRKVQIQIAGFGLFISGVGFLLLRWFAA
jgi:hypothetical protein